jgi:predicted NBD/HSP70 family sugar kinase
LLEPAITTDLVRAVDQRSVRRHNLAVILRHLAANGPSSRAGLAAQTGLTKATVSSLVGQLIERGMLSEQGSRTGAVGRPARTIGLNPQGGAAVGLEIAVDYVAAWVTDLTGAMRFQRFVEQDNREREPAAVVATLAELAEESLGAWGRRRRVPAAVTIALPGLVDPRSASMVAAPNLGWQHTPIGDLWRKAARWSGAPRLDNEANLAALGEMLEGVAQGLDTFVYLSGEIGVGIGIVVDGQLYRGAEGFAGEFGHITIEPEGPPSTWGARGTLETLAGQRAIVRMLGLPEHRGDDADWPAAIVAERLRAGDAGALAAIDRVGRTLGIGVATLANILNPGAVVLGGYFRALSEWLAEPIRDEVRDRFVAYRYSDLRILFSSLGGEAAVRGAAALSLERLITEGGADRAA